MLFGRMRGTSCRPIVEPRNCSTSDSSRCGKPAPPPPLRPIIFRPPQLQSQDGSRNTTVVLKELSTSRLEPWTTERAACLCILFLPSIPIVSAEVCRCKGQPGSSCVIHQELGVFIRLQQCGDSKSVGLASTLSPFDLATFRSVTVASGLSTTAYPATLCCTYSSCTGIPMLTKAVSRGETSRGVWYLSTRCVLADMEAGDSSNRLPVWLSYTARPQRPSLAALVWSLAPH